VLCFLFGGGVAGNLFDCLPKTDDQGGVGGGVAFGMGGHDGGERVIPGDGDGGGADPVGGKILPLPDETLTGALDWSESILSLCFEGESERGM